MRLEIGSFWRKENGPLLNISFGSPPDHSYRLNVCKIPTQLFRLRVCPFQNDPCRDVLDCRMTHESLSPAGSSIDLLLLLNLGSFSTRYGH